MSQVSFGLAALAALSMIPFANAQSMESIPFRLNMSPANEVPAIENLAATGFSTVWVHVLRDAEGKVVSGTVDFTVRYQFPGEVSFTGFHIHRGNAGANGPVVIDSGIVGSDPLVDATGQGQIQRTAQIAAGSAGVQVLEDMLANPEGFYLNLHTTVNRGGAVRAQMTRAERRIYGVPLSPENEVPAVQSEARGVGFVTILAAFNAAGQFVSSEVTFDVNYTGFAEGTQFTGMHIHTGSAGTNGPVTINTGLTRAQNMMAGAGGAGSLRYVADVNMGAQNSVNTVLNIWGDPGTAYLNLHSVANPGGEIRGQLRRTERIEFTTQMSPLNEVPALTNLNASATGSFEANLLRRADGTAMSALGVFNVNYRFPGETRFTGLHIHTGAAGANGPVTIDSGIRGAAPVVSAGAGNIYRTAMVASETQVASLNRILMNPANQYLNLHTTANPGGAVRAQLTAANDARPEVEIVISAVSDVDLRTTAPGGLATIYGTNLALLAGNLEGWQAGRAPMSLNGTSVEIGGQPAAILSVSPRSILAQVPVESSTGDLDLVVTNSNGPSARSRIPVQRTAPAIFFDQITNDGRRAVAFDAGNGAQITQANPASAGSMIGVFGTGFGVASPRQATGEVNQRMLGYPNAMVMLGGQPVAESRTMLIPGYVGFTQTVFMVPRGLSGAQAFEVEYLGVKSNRTVIYLR